MDGQVHVLVGGQGEVDYRAAVEGIGEVLLQGRGLWLRGLVVFAHGGGRWRQLSGDEVGSSDLIGFM